MKFIFASVLSLACLTGIAQANEMYEITSVETTISDDAMILDSFTSEMTLENAVVDEAVANKAAGAASVGEVIQVARDLVALGEEVYTFVQRGRPNVTTEYAPVSVLPRENGRAVDAMDLAGWRAPISRTVTMTYKNLYGMTMASLEYKLVFSYGGNYNGRGAYITNAQIIPSQVYAFYGVDFSATMRLSGIVNQGTRENPTAAAMLHMQYRASTFMNVRESSDTYQITGRGGVTKL